MDGVTHDVRNRKNFKWTRYAEGKMKGRAGQNDKYNKYHKKEKKKLLLKAFSRNRVQKYSSTANMSIIVFSCSTVVVPC